MSLALNETQFASFFKYLKNESLGRPSNLEIKAASIIGLQMNSKALVWILGKQLQLSSKGEIIPEDEKEYIIMVRTNDY